MTTNHQRVTEGLEILTGVLAPCVAGEVRAGYGDEWWDRGVLYDSQKRDLPAGGEDDELAETLDAARCLTLIDVQWNEMFRRKIGRREGPARRSRGGPVGIGRPRQGCRRRRRSRDGRAAPVTFLGDGPERRRLISS